MSDSVTRNINSTVQKTYEWLSDLEQELHTDNRQLAYHVFRSVLHALRDRLPIVEVADLAAELPMLLRGLYYEGWTPTNKPEKLNLPAFLERIEANYNAPVPADPIRFLEAVLLVLEKHIDPGEMNHIRGSMPRDIQNLWPL
jgi:uncharacterized protein (DUF2267 family)